MRAVVGQPATVRLQLATDDGTLTGPDEGTTPTVTVTAGDDVTVLYAAQPGTPDTAYGEGAYLWMLPAQSQLDVLTATWTATVGGLPLTVTEPINVVGRRIVQPAQLRSTYPRLAGLDPASMLWLVDQVEDLVTNVLGYSPVLEGVRPTWDSTRGALTDSIYSAGTVDGLPYGWGGGRMLIPQVRMPYIQAPGAFYAGSINGDAMDDDDIADLTVIDGALTYQDGRPWISGRYTAWLTHGDPFPPRDLGWATAKLCNYFGTSSNFPDRASQVVSENATIWFALPSDDRPTGIPEVDGVLNRYALVNAI